MIYDQITNMLNIGIVVLDCDFKVYYWNRWMELHSGIYSEEIVGTSIFNRFPKLNNPNFLRNYKSVLTFGNFCFFSKKSDRYLFPMRPESSFKSSFEHMQQSCTMGPLRDENNMIKFVFISVQDITDVRSYEQRLIELNTRDGLTGVFNRRFLEEKLEDEFDRCKRYSKDLSLIMFDIDFFKKVNDIYGHQCGDFILKSLSSLVASRIRRNDYLARYGGEEFCCILPETNCPSAALVAEGLRGMVEKEVFQYKEKTLKISISLGVAALEKGIDSVDMLMQLADSALYSAKRTGRNRVVSAVSRRKAT